MSRSSLRVYFDDIEQQLFMLPNLYVEQFNATILTAERANFKLRLRFKGKYLLAISEALRVMDSQSRQVCRQPYPTDR